MTDEAWTSERHRMDINDISESENFSENIPTLVKTKSGLEGVITDAAEDESGIVYEITYNTPKRGPEKNTFIPREIRSSHSVLFIPDLNQFCNKRSDKVKVT